MRTSLLLLVMFVVVLTRMNSELGIKSSIVVLNEGIVLPYCILHRTFESSS